MRADILAGFHGHVTEGSDRQRELRILILLLAAQPRPRSFTRHKMAATAAALRSPLGADRRTRRIDTPEAAWEKGEAAATLPSERDKKKKRKEKRERTEPGAGRCTAEVKEATTAPAAGRHSASPSAPRADWRAIPATRPLRLPIGSCFPPSARALPATAPQPPQSPQPLGALSLSAPSVPHSLSPFSTALPQHRTPSAPSSRDGGSWRRSRLRARAGFDAGQRRRHLPPRQRHNVALEALRSLPPPEGR